MSRRAEITDALQDEIDDALPDEIDRALRAEMMPIPRQDDVDALRAEIDRCRDEIDQCRDRMPIPDEMSIQDVDSLCPDDVQMMSR